MKRQKRNRLERAHHKGYHAGLHGRSSEDCPYLATDAKVYWLGGWREARGDRLSGLYK